MPLSRMKKGHVFPTSVHILFTFNLKHVQCPGIFSSKVPYRIILVKQNKHEFSKWFKLNFFIINAGWLTSYPASSLLWGMFGLWVYSDYGVCLDYGYIQITGYVRIMGMFGLRVCSDYGYIQSEIVNGGFLIGFSSPQQQFMILRLCSIW